MARFSKKMNGKPLIRWAAICICIVILSAGVIKLRVHAYEAPKSTSAQESPERTNPRAAEETQAAMQDETVEIQPEQIPLAQVVVTAGEGSYSPLLFLFLGLGAGLLLLLLTGRKRKKR
jgi:hypothetical protein